MNPIRPRSLLLLLLLSLSPLARAELTIEITKGEGNAVPIAVVPFGWEGTGAVPYDVSSVVASDLGRTGRFKPVPERDMLQKPTSPADIDFQNWRMIDTEVIVIGQIRQQPGGRNLIEFRVFDVFRGEQLLGYQVTSDTVGMRRAAHRISDLIFEKLTGIRGVASTQIVYVAVIGDRLKPTYKLIVADADGESARVLLESRQPIMSPAWSPDGRKLAYVSFENGQSQVFVQELRTGARRRVSARMGVNSAPVWSPDGQKLALTLSKGDGNLDIYVLELNSQVLTRLTNWSSIETEPSWSTDGKSLYFTSDRSGGPQIYRIANTGGSPTRVTFEGNYNARPRVSPDGSKIAVVHNDRGNYRIAIVDVGRSYTQVITEGSQDESPAFAPNGEMLIYASSMGGRGVLSTVSADGRFEQRLATAEGEIREPAWGPFAND